MSLIPDIQIEIIGDADEKTKLSIITNVSILLSMQKGTCPMNRDKGLSGGIVGGSVLQAKGNYTVQVMEQIEKFEPRVTVSEISFESGTDNLKPKVVLIYGN